VSGAVRVARSPEDLPACAARAVTIGNFDGVHIGHCEVIASVTSSSMTSTVVTFDMHPRVFFGGEVPELTSLSRRLELLAGTGVDEILVLPFDAEMAALEPEVWVQRYLERIGTRMVAVGEHFHFGRGRSGNVALLRRLGLDVRVVPLVGDVSSSQVRALVARGEVSRAASMLGRCHELEAKVIDARVRRDVATLVLEPAARTPALPANGRYAARVGERPAVVARVRERLHLQAHLRSWEGAIGDQLRVALRRPLATGMV
jgi:riboflavin kinase/FMN adenylyltransferase